MNKKGITLMSLVATVVIMLLLAGVTFGAIRGGLFGYAGKAKTGTEESSIKQGIQQAFILAKGDSKTNRVSEQNMQHQVDLALPDKNATVAAEGDKLIVIIDNKYYEVDNDGDITGPGKLEPILNAGDITKGGICTGTQANPYKIECIEDLVAFSKDVCGGKTFINQYIIITKDLDFNSIFSYSNYRAKYSFADEDGAYEPDENSTTTIKELCTTGKGFIPIAPKYATGGTTNVFRGTFYAERQTEIKNIHMETTDNAALFGGVGIGAVIRNITISGEITSINNETIKDAAGFIAEGWNFTIENCCNKAKVTNKGMGNATGIFGEGSIGNIINCVNKGDIISENNSAHGIAWVFITINGCRNYGNVKGKSNSSGICRKRLGRSQQIYVELCKLWKYNKYK